MATPNKLEIVLSFKPLMDGLNRFTAGINQRLEQVRAFNQRIQNGDAAMQRMLGQVGTVLGAAALARFAAQAREADKVQAQLIRTLQRTGQTGALEALNAQAAALQRVTHFGDEAINTVQRLLISFGLSAEQAMGLTEAVLDFAQETGQSAESAAMLIGRTLAGESDELGRYKIQLDTTKGKVDALREALAKFAAGAARGGVADKAERDAAARFDDATENLGRAANRVAVPFLSALVPLLERVATAAESLARSIAPVAPMLGDMAAAVLPVVVVLGLFAGAIAAARMLINPLRAAIVLLAGRSLVELNNALAAVTARFGAARAAGVLLADGFTTLAGAGRLLAVVLSVIGAAFVGWQLGSFINEIEVSGLKIKDWTALLLVSIKDKIGGAFSGLQTIWARTRNAWDTFRLYVQGTVLEMAITIADAWNKLPFSRKIDTAPWRAAAAQVAAEVAGLDTQLQARLQAINAARAQQLADNADLAAYIAGTARAPSGNGAGASGAAPGRGDLNGQQFGSVSGDLKAREQRDELERRRALFDLETAILEAKADGNQALIDRLTRERDELQLLNELGIEAFEIIQARLDIEDELRRKQKQRQDEERAHAQRIAELEAAVALIEGNRFLTTEQKQRAVVDLMRQKNDAISESLRLLREELAAGVTDERRGDITSRMDELGAMQAQVLGQIEAQRPLSFMETQLAAVTGWLESIGSLAQQAGRMLSGTLNAAVQGISTSIQGLITRTMTWRDALLNIGTTVIQAVVAGFANMVAQWIVQQIVMAVAGKAIQAAQLAALLPMAAATAAMWAPAATAASIATFGGAAIAGAAMAKAAILSSVIGFATGGLVDGPEQLIRINERGKEFVVSNPAVQKFGTTFLDDLNAGVLNLAALPGDVAAGMTVPDYSAAGGGYGGGGFDAAALVDAIAKKINVTPIVVPDERAAKRIDRRSAAAGDIVAIVRAHRAEIFRSGPV